MSLSNKKFTQTEIGLIPDDWQVTITKKCLSIPITDGPHETPILYEDGIPFISAESVSSGNGRIDFSRMRGYISEEYHQECCKKYKPQKNDVYIIKSGSTTGKVAIVKTDQVFNIWSPLAVLRAKQDIVPDYLFYAVQSSYYQEQIIQAWGMGTQQNIGMRTLEHLKVAYPEYDEQHAISTTLSDMDALITAKTALLEKKRAIKQGAMQELLTGRRRLPGFPVTLMQHTEIGDIPEDWEVKTLGRCASIARGGSPRPIESYLTTSPEGVNWIKIGDVSPGAKYIEDTEEKILSSGAKHSRKVKPGDLLLSNSMSYGRPYILSLEGCIHDGWLTIADYDGDFHRDYLYYALGSSIVVSQYEGLAAGTGVKNLNKKIVADVQVPYPRDFHEQEAIASALSDMDDELVSLERKIEKLVDLKEGMMQNLLTGRIRLV